MVPVYFLIQALIRSEGEEDFMDNFGLFVSPNEVVITKLSDAELSEEFRNHLTKFLKIVPTESGEPMKLIEPTDYNFRGMEPSSIEEFIRDTARELLHDIPAQVQGSKALIEFSLAIDSESDEAKRLTRSLTNILEIPNVRIAFEDGKSITNFRAEEDSVQVCQERCESTLHPRLQTGRPERDSIITDDDHINLKIALETAMSVDDFIAMM